ncbi:PhzF family phenazine biosynthesis protein [Silvimonas terrae]|uniref:PhzF family phenazine biosynthesis protein n=1 Tax=Silvimonas terrae TaxID=300266 RepID=A0A840RFZ3_9NEIS|nr:PhzF family phenazine biosynthesis protein [Silvimonas terrae]MBB5191504.1 PhzF family phenazine biosynthesis protein [Silvimonas terrae]
MASYRYRIVNVFAETPWAGNPLAVFEDARGLDAAAMQTLAQQLNLSETTFVFPSARADAQVRIFTPTYELPFAGHPTLGTAWVLAQTLGKSHLTLEFKAGVIPVVAHEHHRMQLSANAPTYRFAPPAADMAHALGIAPEQVAGTPRFVNTGTEQLVVPLASAEAVQACTPDLALMNIHAKNERGIIQTLVWAWAEDDIVARFFWVQNGQLAEDHGTGSACANLGGWLLAEQTTTLPLTASMVQGHGIGRLAHLSLLIDADKQIHVGGRVAEVGRGEFDWPDHGGNALA